MIFNQDVYKQLEQSEFTGFFKTLHEPIFKSSDMPISYRIINHWHENDLFLYKNTSGKWRKFSVADYLWVLFLNKLRVLNVGLKTIKSVREQSVVSWFGLIQNSASSLLNASASGRLPKELSDMVRLLGDPEKKAQLEEELKAKELQMFSLWLNMGIMGNKEILFRILPDEKHTLGFIEVNEKTDKDKLLNKIIEKGGIFISLQSLLNEFFGERRFKWEEKVPNKFSEEEKKIIGLLREKNYKTVTVHFKQDNINHVQLEEQHKIISASELNGAMLNGKFTQTKIISQDGGSLIVKTQRTIKL